MNMAMFFQKHGGNPLVKMFRKFYFFAVVRGNKQRIKYLRDSGAIIGENVILREIDSLGSEPYLVEIGNNTSFSGGVHIVTHDGSVARLFYMGITPKKYDNFGKVKIGNNCFIGMNSIILKNVTIGDNCIIGAGSVVTKSVPANSVVAGVPAKVIGTVEAFADKNRESFDDTLGMTQYAKRMYITEHMEHYESRRKELEK